jgi:hypothetical protein
MPEIISMTQIEPFKVTPEILADVRENPQHISNYQKAQRTEILKIAMADGEPETPIESPQTPTETTPEIPPETPPDLQVPEPTNKKEGFFKEQKRDAKYWEKRRETAKTEALEEETRLTGLRNKLKDAKELKVETTNDPLDPKHQETIFEQLQRANRRLEVLESYAEQGAEKTANMAKEEAVDSEERATFDALEALQEEYPSLKTKAPVAELNREYAEFLQEIVSTSGIKDGKLDEIRRKAFDRYQSDPEFKKQITRQLPDEMDKLNTLLLAQNRAAAQGGDVEAHLLLIMKKSGALNNVMIRTAQNATQDGASKTLKAMSTAGEIKTIGPGDGARNRQKGTPEENAKETIQALLKKRENRIPWTPEDRAANLRALSILS